MWNDGTLASVGARPGTALQKVLRQLPEGGLERQAVEAGEIDAVIDYGSANVIMFPAARRALRVAANRAFAAGGKAALAVAAANNVLAALPRAAYRRLLPKLEPVTLEFGEVLQEQGALIRHVYFPVDCVVCLLTETDDRRAVKTGLVGYEGMVGTSLALGVDISPVRALVQVAGAAQRMSAACFIDEFLRERALRRELYRCAHVEMAQARQTAACMASHLFEQRLARWLLMTSDRSRSQEIPLTHEYLAAVMNVRRESVTQAAGSLRACGLISYARGKMEILDRQGLEAASCSCYRPIEILHAV
jgi:CRP-like cAMP-binding protein